MRIQERRRAAVHDRHFALAELDHHVVDAGRDQRGQQVLDGFDGGAVAAEHGRVVEALDVVDRGRDVDPEVDAAEHDAGAGDGGLEREADLGARMQADAGARDLTTKSLLSVHPHAFRR